MPLPFSEAQTASTHKPIPDTSNHLIAARHHSSLTSTDDDTDVDKIADQPTVEADKAEPLEVVKQTIDALEAQGLLMVFDRHDQVAKRLTGDLIAAGVLQEEA